MNTGFLEQKVKTGGLPVTPEDFSQSHSDWTGREWLHNVWGAKRRTPISVMFLSLYSTCEHNDLIQETVMDS